MSEKPEPLNVLGEPLEPCSHNPRTGFYRDGCCRTGADDFGRHVICTQVTDEFLQFSQERGNDLSTPRPEFGFPGLKHGDRWCLCAERWQEAFLAGAAPPVIIRATEESALEHAKLSDLKQHALDIT